MRKVLAATAVLALFIAGCTTMQREQRESVKVGARMIEVGNLGGFNPSLYTPPDRQQIKIYITDEQLVVIDQEPVRRNATDSDVTLTWRLQQQGSGPDYSFPDDTAITFMGTVGSPLPPDLGCRTIGAPRKVFVCTYTRERKAQWKYTVRVKNNTTGVELPRLDPWVYQE